MLQPKRSKYRKSFRGRRKGVAQRASHLAFGDFGIKSLGRGWLASSQIEAARRTITHGMKRGGRVWIRIFPDKPVTARAAGQRMGGGKGDIDRYVAVIRPGNVLFEISGINRELAFQILDITAAKLPFKTKVVEKE